MNLTFLYRYPPTASGQAPSTVSVNCEFDWLADAKRVAVGEASTMLDCLSVDILDARGSSIFHWQREDVPA